MAQGMAWSKVKVVSRQMAGKFNQVADRERCHMCEHASVCVYPEIFIYINFIYIYNS